MPFKDKSTKESAKKKPPKKSPTLKLKDEIKSMKSEVDVQKDKYLRLKAEFDNYRRRKERDTVNLQRKASQRLIIRMLTYSKILSPKPARLFQAE